MIKDVDQKVLEKAIKATEGTVKARYHAETFCHAVDALARLETFKEQPRAPKKKAAVKQD